MKLSNAAQCTFDAIHKLTQADGPEKSRVNVSQTFRSTVKVHTFDDQFVKRLKYDGFMLMFLYEVLYEKVALKTRGPTESSTSIQARCNETLEAHIKVWKNRSDNPKAVREAMKASTPP